MNVIRKRVSVCVLTALCIVLSACSVPESGASETTGTEPVDKVTTAAETVEAPTALRIPINEGGMMTPDIGKLNTPDPFITYDGRTDYYYALYTASTNVLIYRSKTLATVFKDEIKVVYSVGGEVKSDIWAPEMYFIGDRWYIYTSGGGIASADESYIKHLFVLESNTEDPFDGFTYKACLSESLYAIDPTYYCDSSSGKSYLCFSGVYGSDQCLCISELENPWTMGEPVIIATPHDYGWEDTDRGSGGINEGPFFLESDGRLFIVYSANGCYNDDYCLGVLELTGGDMLDKNSWVKHDEPIFKKNDGFYATGHASFFKSPDGSETWIAYHCYFTPNDGSWRERYCRVQKIDFDSKGYPVVGEPLPKGAEISVPSGE